MNRLFLSPPHMGDNELKYIEKVFESNYIAPLGEYVDKFEKSICDYTKSSYSLAVTCGTAAIHLALKVLGIKENDDILASSFTFIGSVAPILYEKANPIFIDSEIETWNLDPNLLDKYLSECTKKPKALIITHLYGQVAQIKKIADICKKYQVFLIEDAAESLGATFDGKHSGTFGDFGIYSFNGNKILTTSGGGMLVSSNKEWIDKAKFYSTQAKEPYLHYEHLEVGYNYRMSNVLAAIGVAQMENIEDKVNKKRVIFDLYYNELKNYVEFMPELQFSRGNRWLTTILLKDNTKVNILIKELEKANCESRPLWKPMHQQPIFSENKAILNNVSDNLYSRGLCLPSGTKMTNDDILRICGIIRKICN